MQDREHAGDPFDSWYQNPDDAPPLRDIEWPQDFDGVLESQDAWWQDPDDAPPPPPDTRDPEPPGPTPDIDALKTKSHEEKVLERLEVLRVDRDARRLLDAEERPPFVLPSLNTLRDRLARERIDTRWRIESWLPVNARVMLTAQYKAGKTTLIGNLVRSFVDGDPWLGAASVVPIDGPIILIDAEMSPTQLDEWYREQGVRADDRVVVLPMRGGLSVFNILETSVRSQWAEQFRAIGARYLILDCLRPILDALSLDEQRDTGRFLVAFDALLAEASIPEAAVVHHMGHAGDRARGDSRLRDWPDVEWRLVRENDQPSSARYLTAYGRDVDVPEGALQYNPVWRHLTLVEGNSRKGAAVERALAAAVVVLGEHGKPMSGREVEEAVDEQHHSRKNVRLGLEEGVKRGTVRCQKALKRGQANFYSLPTANSTEQPPASPEQKPSGSEDI